MKTISVYIKGGQTSPNYYRIYQYTNNISGYKFEFRTMMPEAVHRKFMPLSKQPIYIKITVYLIMYFRILYFLIYDYISKPAIVVITRRVINRIMPFSYKLLLKKIHKYTPIIWDFDDDLIDGKEVTRKTFDFYAKISNVIFCTHSHLAKMVPNDYKDKIVLLPTTDGDIYRFYIHNQESVIAQRARTLNQCVKLVWVATNVNMPHLLSIAPVLDAAAKRINELSGRSMQLEVICNGELNYNFKYLNLINTTWTRDKAIQGILSAHIGIMPLANTQYAKGKGGFKLVQYISAGLPCIGSNVGFNSAIINEYCGILASSETDWIDGLINLADPVQWPDYSKSAFKTWTDNFSFEKNLKCWRETLDILSK